MRRIFGQVGCGDECPIVRRAAAPVLSKLVEIVKSEGKGTYTMGYENNFV